MEEMVTQSSKDIQKLVTFKNYENNTHSYHQLIIGLNQRTHRYIYTCAGILLFLQISLY